MRVIYCSLSSLLLHHQQIKMTSKNTGPPQFIQLGAEVLSSLIKCASEDVLITPELLRRAKMGQLDSEDKVVLDLLGSTLVFKFDKGGVHPSSYTIQSIAALMVNSHCWMNYCIEKFLSLLTQHCPNVLHWQAFMVNEPEFNRPNEPYLEINDEEFGRYIEAKYSALSYKLAKLRSLEECRLGNFAELLLLLKEAGIGQEEEILTNSLLQNIIDGSMIVDHLTATVSLQKVKGHIAKPATGKTEVRGSDSLHSQYSSYLDLLSSLEAQLQSEEIFWKWLLSFNTSDDTSQANVKLKSGLQALECALFPLLMQPRYNSSDTPSKLIDLIKNIDIDITEKIFLGYAENLGEKLCSTEGCEGAVDKLFQHSISSSSSSLYPEVDYADVSQDLNKLREYHEAEINSLVQSISFISPYKIGLKKIHSCD